MLCSGQCEWPWPCWIGGQILLKWICRRESFEMGLISALRSARQSLCGTWLARGVAQTKTLDLSNTAHLSIKA